MFNKKLKERINLIENNVHVLKNQISEIMEERFINSAREQIKKAIKEKKEYLQIVIDRNIKENRYNKIIHVLQVEFMEKLASPIYVQELFIIDKISILSITFKKNKRRVK